MNDQEYLRILFQQNNPTASPTQIDEMVRAYIANQNKPVVFNDSPTENTSLGNTIDQVTQGLNDGTIINPFQGFGRPDVNRFTNQPTPNFNFLSNLPKVGDTSYLQRDNYVIESPANTEGGFYDYRNNFVPVSKQDEFREVSSPQNTPIFSNNSLTPSTNGNTTSQQITGLNIPYQSGMKLDAFGNTRFKTPQEILGTSKDDPLGLKKLQNPLLFSDQETPPEQQNWRDILSNTPSTGNNLVTAGALFGTGSTMGKVLGSTILGSNLLGGTREFLGGFAATKSQNDLIAQANQNIKNQRQQARQMPNQQGQNVGRLFEDGGNVVAQVAKQEITQEVNPLEMTADQQVPMVEVEVEKGEHLFDPNTGNIAKVEDIPNNGHNKGGVKISAADGTQVLSNKLTPDTKTLQKEIKEVLGFDLNLSKNNTYADVLDKINSKLGITKLMNEQADLIKKTEKKLTQNPKSELQEKTNAVNTDLTAKKVQEIQKKIDEKKPQQLQAFQMLFERQEQSKGYEDIEGEEIIMADGGRIKIMNEDGEYFTSQADLPKFQAWAREKGFTDMEQVNEYFEMGGLISIMEKGGTLKAGGHKFSGYNKPISTPNHKTKSHAVLAKEGDTVKLIRFGQQGVKGAGKNPKTAKEKARRKSFKARHAKNIAKGRLSASYWSNKVKWSDGGEIEFMDILTQNVQQALEQGATKEEITEYLLEQGVEQEEIDDMLMEVMAYGGQVEENEQGSQINQIAEQVIGALQQGATQEQVVQMLMQQGIGEQEIQQIFQFIQQMQQQPQMANGGTISPDNLINQLVKSGLSEIEAAQMVDGVMRKSFEEGGTTQALSTIPRGQKRTGNFFGGVTQEQFDKFKEENRWYKDIDSLDPRNPDSVEAFQKAFNEKVELYGGNKIEPDGNFGQQTVSARVIMNNGQVTATTTPSTTDTQAAANAQAGAAQTEVEKAKGTDIGQVDKSYLNLDLDRNIRLPKTMGEQVAFLDVVRNRVQPQAIPVITPQFIPYEQSPQAIQQQIIDANLLAMMTAQNVGDGVGAATQAQIANQIASGMADAESKVQMANVAGVTDVQNKNEIAAAQAQNQAAINMGEYLKNVAGYQLGNIDSLANLAKIYDTDKERTHSLNTYSSLYENAKYDPSTGQIIIQGADVSKLFPNNPAYNQLIAKKEDKKDTKKTNTTS